MCFIEGQGVDGDVGDESSPYRNTFVSVFEYVSLFSLSSPLSCLVVWCGAVRCGAVRCGAVRCGVVWCRVVWCLVCVLACVCWRAAHSPQFPSRELELNSFIRYCE